MSQSVNPEMIVLARESRGVTQQELAEKIGVGQHDISRIESGFLSRLAVNKLRDISHALRYPEKFFYQTFRVYPAGMHLYRKHKTIPAKDLSRIEAWMNIYREHIKHLLSSVDIDFQRIKECELDEYGSPEEIARAIRQYVHLPRGPVENMTGVLENLGVVVVPFKADSRMFSGASLLTEKPNYIVVINADMPGDRWRFTLAHELGHMVMHSLPTPAMEEEADRFASEFLMPSDEIGHYLANVTLDKLASLKKHWKVAMSAILMKARDLEKITDRQYRTSWEKMGKAGYRLQEPKELEIPLEKPSLLQEILTAHFGDLQYSPEQLSEKLMLDPMEFYSLYTVPLQSPRLRLVSNLR